VGNDVKAILSAKDKASASKAMKSTTDIAALSESLKNAGAPQSTAPAVRKAPTATVKVSVKVVAPPGTKVTTIDNTKLIDIGQKHGGTVTSTGMSTVRKVVQKVPDLQSTTLTTSTAVSPSRSFVSGALTIEFQSKASYSNVDMEAAVRRGIADAAGVSVDDVEVKVQLKEDAAAASVAIIHVKFKIHHPKNSAADVAKLLEATDNGYTGSFIERAYQAAGIDGKVKVTSITAVATTADGTTHAVDATGGMPLVVSLHVPIACTVIAMFFA